MAKLVNGILGGFIGKVGTVVGFMWKGKAVIRTYIASIANPNTEDQLVVRSKFKLVVQFLKTMTAFLRLGFKNSADGLTSFNAAVQYNLKNAVTGVFPVIEMNYSNNDCGLAKITFNEKRYIHKRTTNFPWKVEDNFQEFVVRSNLMPANVTFYHT